MMYNHRQSQWDFPEGLSRGVWEITFQNYPKKETYTAKVLGYSIPDVLSKVNLGEEESILEVKYLFDIDVFTKPKEANTDKYKEVKK